MLIPAGPFLGEGLQRTPRQVGQSFESCSWTPQGSEYPPTFLEEEETGSQKGNAPNHPSQSGAGPGVEPPPSSGLTQIDGHVPLD